MNQQKAGTGSSIYEEPAKPWIFRKSINGMPSYRIRQGEIGLSHEYEGVQIQHHVVCI